MSPPQGKDRLISELAILLRNFVFGQQLSADFMKDRGIAPRITFTTETAEQASIDVRSLYVDATTGKMISPPEIVAQFRRGLSRAIVAESHETIQVYCRETNQTVKHVAAPFYQFARIMRNVTSHERGGILTQWPSNLSKKGITTIQWQNRTISASMIGQLIGLNDVEIIRLIKDEIEFIETQLN